MDAARGHLRRHWHDCELAFMVEAWALLESGWTAGVAVAGAAKGQDMPWRLDAARAERLRVAEHGGDRDCPLADAVSELVGDGTGTALVAKLRGMYSETEMAAIEDALRRGVLVEEEEEEGQVLLQHLTPHPLPFQLYQSPRSLKPLLILAGRQMRGVTGR